MNDITLSIAGQLSTLGMSRLRVQQQINDIPLASIELLIPNDNSSTRDDKVQWEIEQMALGATVEISLDKKTLFSGYLVQKRVRLQGKRWTITLEARHLLQKLTFLPRSRVFQQQTDASSLKGLLQQVGLKLTLKAATQLNDKHEQIIQFRLSDWQFIRSRLLSTNCWLLPDATSASVVITSLAVPTNTAGKLEGHSDAQGYSLYDINLNFDSRFTPESVTLQGWDIATQRLSAAQKSQAKSFCPWTPKTKPSTVSASQQEYTVAFSHLPEPELQNMAKSWLSHQQMTGLQGRILMTGTRDFSLGESVELSRLGAGLNGTILISGVNHYIDSENEWRTELLVGMPPDVLEPTSAVRSLHIAKVANFVADPEHLDRIAIHLPALNLPGTSIFARLSKPWASKASGFCFYPEQGDEVVVGFIESDPRYPIILGALHNPENTAPFPPDKKNNLKGLVVDKDGTQAALLMNTEEKTLVLSCAQNEFALTGGGNMTLSTPKSMTISADTQVEITSASINLKKG